MRRTQAALPSAPPLQYAPTRQPHYPIPTTPEPICEEILRSTDHLRVINWLHCTDYAPHAIPPQPPTPQPAHCLPRPPILPPVQPMWPARSVSLVYRGDNASVLSDSSDDDGGA